MRTMTISVVSDSEKITKEILVNELRNDDLIVPITHDWIDRVIYSEYSVTVLFKVDVTVSTDELFHFINNHEQIVSVHLR